jgi:hypothetical protein
MKPRFSQPSTVPGGLNPRAQAPSGRAGQRGVALIISLILLAVITFMAVTFLVVSRSERGAVSTSTDQTIAREAANTAADRAIAEALASIMAWTNAGNYQLAVSTNYISSRGFVKGLSSYTNVNFNYTDGTAVRGDDALQNLTNLLYNPRVPVYITNELTHSNDFRFYVDLNRNGRYDTNGWQPEIGPNGRFYHTNYSLLTQPQSGVTISNFMVGDPEWIGRLERADLPHSSTNRFVYRYAYLVVPAGKTLDINSAHNYARRFNNVMDPASGDGFTRNMGVGTWELNLGSFLVDLNTNYWPYGASTEFGTPYRYNTNLTAFNMGSGFEDALFMLRYRYGANYAGLASFQDIYGTYAADEYGRDWSDGYVSGPLMRGTTWKVTLDQDASRVDQPWMGADNTNRFFTTQELFDTSKVSVNFSNRLWTAGTNSDSYNRYTFYRLLSQLGTDTTSDSPRGKINLNYDNKVQSNRFTGLISATNFLGWRAVDFFTNTAQRLIENAGYNPTNVSVNYIQLYPTNMYTPSIHQLLQLAANIYDSTTNRDLNINPDYPYLPSVFRPLFGVTNGPGGTNIVFVKGYEEVDNVRDLPDVGSRWFELGTNTPAGVNERDMLWGVPLVVGAKKGLPNFNELAMQTMVQMTRKLEFRRPTTAANAEVNETNVMYTLSISNVLGVEAWNSYSNAYPRRLALHTLVQMYATLTNDLGQTLMATRFVQRSNIISLNRNTWDGFVHPYYSAASFQIPLPPLGTNAFYFLTNSIYRANTMQFVPLQNQAFGFERHPGASQFPAPRWFLNLRTRMRFMMVDESERVIDFVNIDRTEQPLDLAAILSMDGRLNTLDGGDGSMWSTNRLGDASGRDVTKPTYGILNQIAASSGEVEVQTWNSDPQVGDKEKAIGFFKAQFTPGTDPLYSKTNVFYSAYVPSRTVYFLTEWQANDPLVHYTLGDLMDLYFNFPTNRISFVNTWTTNNVGSINKRYEPWGGNPSAGSTSPSAENMAFKDPMVTRSDDWDFPTNKYPNVGWLGRVHRGTPWQTIDLKSPQTDLRQWARYSGNGVLVRNVGQYNTNVVAYNIVTNDAAFTLPVNDRYIVDLFTTAVNENAARGQLSVNNTNLAAWSAVLAGVNVLQNVTNNLFIEPAGVYYPTNPTPVARIVQGIQRAMTNYPGGMFHRLGDFLATPELTAESPFLESKASRKRDMTDAVYERIPQQILGLLKGPDQPRFVIYAYGQALKPANKSLIPGGTYSGLCTNYQITAEVATRTVVRIEGTPDYPRPVGPQDRLNNLRAVVESFNVLPPE